MVFMEKFNLKKTEFKILSHHCEIYKKKKKLKKKACEPIGHGVVGEWDTITAKSSFAKSKLEAIRKENSPEKARNDFL